MVRGPVGQSSKVTGTGGSCYRHLVCTVDVLHIRKSCSCGPIDGRRGARVEPLRKGSIGELIDVEGIIHQQHSIVPREGCEAIGEHRVPRYGIRHSPVHWATGHITISEPNVLCSGVGIGGEVVGVNISDHAHGP